MITAYTGLPGMGKTLSMTYQGFKYWQKFKCPVFANYNLQFPYPKDNKQYNVHYGIESLPFGIYKYWQSVPQKYFYPSLVYGKDFLEVFKQVKDALILIDECGSVFDNRQWRKFDTWIMRRFRESRHHNLEIMYTAQNVKDVEPKIRQLTNFEVKCKMYKFRNKPYLLSNQFYHSEVITNDTQKNRKEFHFLTDLILKKSFSKVYKMYDTYEELFFEVVNFKPINELIKRNIFEYPDQGADQAR